MFASGELARIESEAVSLLDYMKHPVVSAALARLAADANHLKLLFRSAEMSDENNPTFAESKEAQQNQV